MMFFKTSQWTSLLLFAYLLVSPLYATAGSSEVSQVNTLFICQKNLDPALIDAVGAKHGQSILFADFLTKNPKTSLDQVYKTYKLSSSALKCKNFEVPKEYSAYQINITPAGVKDHRKMMFLIVNSAGYIVYAESRNSYMAPKIW